ncbi:MAG: single-stranded-DNA-specific exonuclease RecJ [Gemmatimonadota bacterium]
MTPAHEIASATDSPLSDEAIGADKLSTSQTNLQQAGSGLDTRRPFRIPPRWRFMPPPRPEAVERLTRELRLPSLVASLLDIRGYGDPEAARAYLRPRLDQLHNPALLKGLTSAVARLVQAIRAQETVFVHGDYDVDGICSTTILVKVLRHLGGKAIPFVPHRLRDGYDLSQAGVEAAVAAGAGVVVTCDCGTTAHEAIAQLVARGVDVIVTDHHLPSRPVPECSAVLNPRQPDCPYPDKDLCAAGVVYKLAAALLDSCGASPNVALNQLDLVALATIADVAPLRGENRAFARYGLKLMIETKHPGLRALIEASGIAGQRITAGRVGFVLAPRLNASGRVGHAMRGIDLMMSEVMGDCYTIARELEELNRARQELDRQTLEVAREMVLKLDLESTFGIALGASGWHPGVIGIVASRLVEEFCRPVMLVALDGDTGKGSGRSISAFDLHRGLVECQDLLLRFGGHRAAAGITIDSGRLDDFALRFNEIARSRLTPEDLVPEMKIDLELGVDDITLDLEAMMRHFEPFGVGNPGPMFAVRGARLAGSPRCIGQDGLKLFLRGERTMVEAIGWGMAHRAAELDDQSRVDLAFRIERDSYGGQDKVVARICDLRT